MIDKYKLKKFLSPSLLVLCSLAGLYASFELTLDYIKIVRNPDIVLPCDVNGILSCSTVSKSPQATLLNYFGEPIPNSLLGIIVYVVFITIGVTLIGQVKMPKWFMSAGLVGLFGGVIFTYWLSWQSAMVIRALCPYCMLMMVSTNLMFFIFMHFSCRERLLILPNNLSETLAKNHIYVKLFGFGWMVLVFGAIISEYLYLTTN